ncbi:MAG: hypothetical protein Q9179_007191, partial [Wetmoreana sp. 5 TL-2023]
PVVRTAPNELSFNTAQSWKDIYDFRQGHLTFIKSDFYDGGSFADRCGSIVSERNPTVHGAMRKQLSHAFSQRSLMEQEDLISKSVDRFIAKLGEDGTQSINIVRINRKTDRKDFYTRILENREPGAFSDVQLAAHASDFVLAGSETSSTCLSTITYYLLKTPTVAEKLKREIRGAFASYEDINATSTTTLEYMNAVIQEAMRIYPPLPFGIPRVVPEGGDTVGGHFLPAGVSSTTREFADGC